MSQSTSFLSTRILALDDPAAQAEAIEYLDAGQVIAAPTDTVYGIFCRPEQSRAIERLYEVKGRPPQKAIPILVAEEAQLASIVRPPLSPLARHLMARFWPGALTLVLMAQGHLPAVLTAGQPTIAVRMPDHEGLRALLRRTGPLAATSANRSGGDETHHAQEVLVQLGDRIPLILADPLESQQPAETQRSPASTIVDLSGDEPFILRPGALEASVQAALAAWAG